MDRQTRREQFERICALREAHTRLGPDDTTSVITIEVMIARASRLLARMTPRSVEVPDGEPRTSS